MATALENTTCTLLKCPICLELCIEPRKLPGCTHYFCEACIATYVSISKGTGKTGEGILCPSCRSVSTGPEHAADEGKIREWLDSLEKYEGIATAVSLDHRTEQLKKNRCGSCKMFGISSKASKFCIVCFESFCDPCFVGRHSYQHWMNHKTIDIKSEDKEDVIDTYLNGFLELKDYSVCNIHSCKEIEFYCKDDESLCCATCIVYSHRKCIEIVELKDTSLGEEAKKELEQVKQSMDKLSAYASTVMKARNTNKENRRKQSEELRRTLQEQRAKINEILDALEDNVTAKTKSVIKQTEIVEEQDISVLKETMESLRACMCLTDRVISYGSAGHFYGLMKEMKEKLEQHRATVFDLCDNFKNVSPELKLEKMLQHFVEIGLNDTHKLANIVETSVEMNLPKYEERDIFRNRKVTKCKEVCIQENYTGILSPTYCDLTLLPNNKIALVDKDNGYCCFVDENYKVIASRKLMSYKTNTNDFSNIPCSCTYINNGTIAVSAPNQKRIFLLSQDTHCTIEHVINTKYKPRAIQGLNNGNIAVSWEEPVAFGIISTDETPTEELYFCLEKTGRQSKILDYMAVDERRNHAILPFTEDKAVYCFDFAGVVKFKYTDALLTCPKGVALDGDGNIYICEYNDKNSAIHVISPTGQPIRVLKEDCPTNPLAIAFCGEEFGVTRYCSPFRVVTFFKFQHI